MVKVGTSIAALGYEGAEDVDLALDQSEQMIFSLSQQRSTDGVADIKAVLMDTFERIENLYETKVEEPESPPQDLRTWMQC